MSRRGLRILIGWFVLVGLAFPRQDPVVCGTDRAKRWEQLHLHRQAGRAGLKPRLVAPAQASTTRDAGQISILEDSGGVVAYPNIFDLDGRTLSFEPAAADASRYRFEVGGASYDSVAATNGSKLDGLGDDDAREIPLPFPFPFYGSTYQQVYVNSDGNLTFNSADVSTSERSLGRVTSGPPRIAGLFSDLDPSKPGQGVRVLSDSDRVVVSWEGVPAYQGYGVGPAQTFQVRLYPGGRIEFAYAGVSALDAVVGISPGGLEGQTAVVDLTTGSAQAFPGTIAERFGSTAEIDVVSTAQRFYETHDDSYDYLVIFNTLDIQAASGAVSYEITVRNDRSGYGDIPVDDGSEYGSRRRLQAVMNMGPLSQFPADPNATVGPRGLVTGDTTLTILAHEAGHLFLAFASIRDPDNPDARPMLGFQLAHWSFNFDSEASLLEGNRIRDDGSGVSPRFTTTGTVEGFSPLDQYLMGFRAPEEVVPPDLFLVNNPLPASSPSRLPQVGVSFNGDRRDIQLAEIVDSEGRRTPDHTVSQRYFRFAFLLIVPEGSDPSQADLDKVDNFRQNFETYYNRATSARAQADTGLRRSLTMSTFPAAGVVAGASIPVSLSLERPAGAALTVLLQAPNGFAGVPASVTIPAGQTSATFQVTGLSPGVEDVTATPADNQYETMHCHIQVLAARSALKLEVSSGGQQVAMPGTPLAAPIVLRATDINELPYPGLRVVATASDGGSIVPASAITDDKGTVLFNWTPGTGAVHQLTATFEGASSSSVAVSLPAGPSFTAAGVVSAASFHPGLSPGGFTSVFGSGLAAGGSGIASPPYPFTLGGVQILLNGNPAPLQYVSDQQINFVAPLDLASGTTTLAVSNPFGTSAAVSLPVVSSTPGIFVIDYATNAGAVLVHSTGRTTEETPAGAGDDLEIYATGLGAVQPSAANPGLQETVTYPQVFLGGSTALAASFSGLQPSFPGLYQVNARVPAGVPTGDQGLVLEINGVRSNEVRIRLR